MAAPRRRTVRYAVSLPERGARAVIAALGGMLHESAELLLPRVVRRSRLYEATARNALRVAVELVGGVTGRTRLPGDPEAGEIAARKIAGNVVEVSSIAAFGFSPLWLLAGASDALHGSRVYLDALVAELVSARVVPEGTRVESIDQLLGVLQRVSGRVAGLVDVPPLELAGLRLSMEELGQDVRALPTPAELARTFAGLRAASRAEEVSLLETSAAIGLAFLVSARAVGRAHVVDPYRADWRPVGDEGIGAYLRRIAVPYRAAIEGHFDPDRATLTERALRRSSGSDGPC